MLFESRVLHTWKDLAGDYEDAFQLDGERGLVAIADGVSSAIFSRLWADILTRSVVAEPPDLYQEAAFKLWLSERRRAWLAQIDVTNLPWNQRQKLQEVGGAFSTLMWLQVSREVSDNGGTRSDSAFRCRCFGIGDCSLFHVRDGAILRAFPLTTTAEFERDPISICSVNLNRDHGLEFSVLDEVAQDGDLLVLCTDAIGKWAVTRMQADDPPRWDVYWEMPHDEWLAEIAALRQGNQMRFDDTTLVLLRLKKEHACELAGGCDEPTAPMVLTEAGNVPEAEPEANAEESPVESNGTDGTNSSDETSESLASQGN